MPGALLIVVVCFLSWATLNRNRAYHSAQEIWADTIKKWPQNWRAHYNYGRELSFAGKHKAAIVEYQRALDLRPDYPQAWNNLGNEAALAGDAAKAKRILSQGPGV